MDQSEQIKDAIAIIWNQRKPIIRWTILSAIFAAALSLLLKNYYKATTTFYPSSLDLIMPDKIFGNSQNQMEFYGSGADLDRLLTICSSNELKDKLVNEFDLYQHYNIDSTKNLAKFKIRKKLNKLLYVTKTKYDAIELSIEDQDKHLAAQMTNKARDIVNESSHHLIVNRLEEMARLYQTSVNEKMAFVNKMSDSLSILRKKFPIYNIESQSETLGNLITELNSNLIGEQARYESLKKSNARKDTLGNILARISSMQKQIDALNGSGNGNTMSLSSFNEGVNKIAGIQSAIERTLGQINEDKIKLQNTQNTVASVANAVITVHAAELPDYKSRPKRSILVLAAALLTAMALSMYYLLRHYSLSSAKDHDKVVNTM